MTQCYFAIISIVLTHDPVLFCYYCYFAIISIVLLLSLKNFESYIDLKSVKKVDGHKPKH